MQNTFSQSGNDSKWFLKNIIFQNRYVALETPSRPPPFMANAILNFHFDYWHTSLRHTWFSLIRLILSLFGENLRCPCPEEIASKFVMSLVRSFLFVITFQLSPELALFLCTKDRMLPSLCLY